MWSKIKDIFGTVFYIAAIIIICIIITTFVAQRIVVNGDSMESTLSNGDNLICDKISYHFTDPKRFDIVVFPFRYNTDTLYIKRIIGLPGETIYIDDDGTIFIDNKVLAESHGREVIADPGRAHTPIKLGDDEYFVMGDNRNYSSDSRDPAVGSIHKNEFIGRVLFRIWPLNKIKIN
ncbi:MAG: signal peptidase I [Lachnospiraceae bacterium]|nr:signal peptidase I [Lachnospiraceae bacterium]